MNRPADLPPSLAHPAPEALAQHTVAIVQVRSVLFHEIIRALVREGVPTPGADRLAVTTHIGTLDMMALGDVLSNSADSLQLAALLRSPLFDVSEDDLRAVAQPRGDGVSLWAAMRDSTLPSIRQAFETLRDWRFWLLLGGRGSGKTRAGAEWVQALVRAVPAKSSIQ